MELFQVCKDALLQFTTEHGFEVAGYFAAFAGLTGLVSLSLPLYRSFIRSELKPKENDTFGWLVGSKVVSFVHALLVAPRCLYALFKDPVLRPVTIASITLDANTLENFAETQLFYKSETAAKVVPITVAYFFFDLCNVSIWEGGGTPYFNELMVLHHIFSVLLFPVSLLRGVGHWYLLHLLAYEISTPFIYIRWFVLNTVGEGILDKITAFSFLAAFLVFRTFTIPSLFLSLLHSFAYHKRDPVLKILAYSAYIPMGLNLFWAISLLRIAANELSNGKKK